MLYIGYFLSNHSKDSHSEKSKDKTKELREEEEALGSAESFTHSMMMLEEEEKNTYLATLLSTMMHRAGA